ncbi:MAG: leucine-rich repeat protein [Ruminococcus sp.]|nr:leucine-rich repeat protein [Ruminococcus sp.]
MKKTMSILISGIISMAAIPFAAVNAEDNTELWEDFLKYDLCITDYESLTEKEQELCHFIFDTETNSEDTVVCERARKILAHDNAGERITLENLENFCGIWDKNNDNYGTLNYIHCVPDISHIDNGYISSPKYYNEYWLDDNGDTKVIFEMRPDNKNFIVVEKENGKSYEVPVKNSQFISKTNNNLPSIEYYDLDKAIEVNDDYYYIASDGTAVLFKNKYNDDFNYEYDTVTEPHIIPSEVDGHKVTAIETEAFICSPYVEIVFPDSLEYIGYNAFGSCKNLEKVNFPKGLKAICAKAFAATNLKEIKINCPDLVIGEMAFAGLPCEEAEINAKEIGTSTFYLSENLKKITFGENTEKIGANAFKSCTSLEAINLSSSVKTLGEGAFTDNKSLKSITIPDSVKIIGTFPHKTGKVVGEIDTIPAYIPLLKEPSCVFDSGCEIKGYKGTEAESYAQKWKLNFIAVDEDNKMIIGDANCDGQVSMADAVLIMQYISNPNKYSENGTDKNHITEQGKKNADIAGENDGVTNADALAIQKKLLKLDQ